jgi:hypothetical protein
LQDGGFALAVDPEIDVAAARREPQRVVEQIADHRRQRDQLGANPARLDDFEAEIDAAIGSLRQELGHDVLGDLIERNQRTFARAAHLVAG